MERGSKRFTRFMNEPGNPASISGEYVHCIYEDTNGHIWVGTRGKGLNMMMDDGKSFRHFTTEDGLPGNSIYGILADERGFLWLSTENGLSRFDPQTLTCKNFNRDDGLVCKEFNFNSYYKDERYMYFGGYNGIVYFDPASIKGNGVVPTLALTRLKLFNKEIRTSGEKDAVLPQRLNHTEELEFRYHQNVFSVEFAVLNYINARKNQFAYRLEGFEDQWNYVKEPVATYMNLKPGHYTLQVRGANNDGVWNEKPLTLAIHILPPPWKTWWAYSIYLTLFLALLYTWSRFNKRQVQLEHELQIEHLEKQKQEELHQAKLNFFTNIAHEIRTPLTLMVGPVDQLSERLQQDAYLKKEIGLVKTNSDRLLRLLNQLLDFQKQETGNVRLKVRKENFVEFIREIQVPFQEFAESRKISMHLHTQETNVPLWFDKEELSKVFYNLLANAFKFTPGGGKVLIGITKEENQDPAGSGESYRVKITIEDNGLGIAASQLEKIFHRFYQAENTGVHEAGFGIGLALAKGIIDLHHGEITVESQEATHDIQGFTRFTIWMMGGNAHFDKEQLCTEEKLPEIAANEEITLAAEAPERSSNDPYLVLVVEDNEDIRRYIRDTLRHHHYEVLESSNGQEGWQTAIDKLPDLILSDVMMSGMNGLDLVTKIKSDVRTSHIPVILLTARASVNHQVEGLVTGADDYITKPFNNQLLLVKIKNHLEIREKLKEKYSKIVTLQPQQDEVEDPDDRFLRKLMEVLETNLLDPEFNVTRLVREIGMSRPVLFRKTKMLTGLSVIDLIRSVRLKKAEMLLKQCKLSVSEVAFAVGFSDPKYFSKSFKDQYGKSPSQFMGEIANNIKV
jgi:signal transduction histidine kinase/DNA-binding response OmpR family regulator